MAGIPPNAKWVAVLVLAGSTFLVPPSWARDPVDPGKRQIDFALGLFQRGDHREAADEFSLYLENKDWIAQRDIAFFFSGEAFRQLDEASIAAERYRSLLAESPNSEYADMSRYRLAAILLETREGGEALAVLEPLSERKLAPDLEEGVWYSLGVAHSLLDQATESITWWRRALEKYPENETGRRALFGIGLESARMGDCEESEAHLERWLAGNEVEKNPAYSEAVGRLAECKERLGKKNEALDLQIDLSRTESSHREDGILSAMRLAFELEKWDAFEALEKTADGELGEPRLLIRRRILSGNRAYGLQYWKKAASHFTEAIVQSSQLPEEDRNLLTATLDRIRVRSAWCAFALQDWTSVENRLKDVSEIALETEEVRYLNGEAARNQAQWQVARQWFAKVGNDSEYKREARIGEAEAALRGEEWKLAAQLYTRLAVDTEDAEESAFYLLKASEAERRLERWSASAILCASAVLRTASPEIREKTLYLEGWSHAQAEEWQGVFSALGGLVRDFPASEKLPESLALLGSASRNVSDPTRECEFLERLVTEFPDSPWSGDGLIRLAAAYSARSVRSGVLSALLRFQNRHPDTQLHVDYALWLAEELVDSGSAEPALATLRGLLDRDLSDQERERALSLSGQCHELREEWAKALAAYEESLSAFPEGGRSLDCLLGAARSAKELDRREEAKKSVDQALGRVADKPTFDMDLEGQLYILAGDLAFEDEDFEAAYRYYARPGILLQHPRWTPLALHKSALCRDRMGQPEKGRELREEIARDYPGFQSSSAPD